MLCFINSRVKVFCSFTVLIKIKDLFLSGFLSDKKIKN